MVGSNVGNGEVFHTIFRKDRESATTGGGIFQAVKEDLVTTRCKATDDAKLSAPKLK